jgi:LytS/YehU family sensor histidine kinase
MVPALLLQPLVENAVKHGVLTLEEGGVVSVVAERNNGTLRLSVADSGPGVAKDRSAGRGVGLSNTASRLQELYGNLSRITLSPSSIGGLEVTVEIPFRPATAPAEGNGRSGDHV